MKTADKNDLRLIEWVDCAFKLYALSAESRFYFASHKMELEWMYEVKLFELHSNSYANKTNVAQKDTTRSSIHMVWFWIDSVEQFDE